MDSGIPTRATFFFFAIAFTAAATVEAAPIIYFGENQFPGGTVSGAPLTARTNFLSQLTGVGNEGFESFSDSATTPLALTFPGSSGSITATLTGSGSVYDSAAQGRFNTTPSGTNLFEADGTFEIAFSSPISAFGFYGTDIGDFAGGQLTIALTGTDDVITNFVVDNTINGANGSLLFWGIIDSQASFKRISFANNAFPEDVFAIDDLVIGDPQQVSIPEPATFALLGLGLAGLAASRRRKK